jgi:Icc-related predicted phosphoesterase
MREKIFRKVHYLRDSGVRIGGKFFYGSPWTPRFFDWAFNADRGPAIDKYWDWIPLYTNVLISHGPPMGILDRVGNEHVGCANLRQRVERLSLGANIFGHIHCGAGTKTLAGTQYVNAAVLDERYRFANAPVVIEI